MKPRIGVVGGVNMDIHLFKSAPAPHGPLMAEYYIAEPGGKGANQARAAARLGAEVTLVAAVGSDEYGRECLAAITKDGVDANHVVEIEGDRTGFVVIDLVAGHHVTRVFVPGANHRLEWAHLQPALPALERCDALVAQAEIPGAALEQLAAWSQAARVPLYLDPTPPESVSVATLAAAEVLTPNLAEVAGLTGRVVAGEIEARLAARDLLDAGAQRLCVKLGAGGTVIAGPEGFTTVPTSRVDVIDETGGGDVFMAGLVTSRISGAGWGEAVTFANAAGAISVSHEGLYLPTRTEVDALAARLR